MCDLFALSAKKDYSAPEFLPVFSFGPKRTWMAGALVFIVNTMPLLKSRLNKFSTQANCTTAFKGWPMLVKSRGILCHLRFRTSGLIDECHAHPFVLKFGGHDWMFAHNGKAPAIESYRSSGIAIEDAISDSARAFEHLRDCMEDHHREDAKPEKLFNSLATVLRK